MSAQKQCPKCGEKNPAEAVMCWACYTSLSGGPAPATAGGPAVGGAMAGAMTGDAAGGEKKKIEPKQLAIIGVGLLIAVGFGLKTVMGGGGGGEEELPMFPGGSSPMMPAGTSGGSGSVGPSNPAPAGAVPAAPGTNPASPGGGPGTVPFPYTMVSGPNPQAQWAVMAIVPNQGALKESEARGLATFAHRYQEKVKKFPAWEILVINNQQAGELFAKYQNPRRGARLESNDYQQLAAVWASTPVRYVCVNGKISYSSPQKNPDSFWKTASG